MKRSAMRLSLLALAVATLMACDSDFPATTVVVPPPPNPGGNTAPDAQDQSFAGDEDTLLQATVVASDADGDTLTYTVSSAPPANGDLRAFDNASGEFEYLPKRDFVGTDTFEVRISDGNGGAITIVISLNISCPANRQQCGFDKFDLVDLPNNPNAREPSIAVDTAVRVNVAFVEDNSANGGTTGDLFVFQTAPLGRSFSQLPGSGPNGALNDLAPAARPDIMGSLVPPTAISVAWDEGNNIIVESRTDMNGAWSSVSGVANLAPAIDPALTLDPITGAPLVMFASEPGALNRDVNLAYNTGNLVSGPGVWMPQNGPLDVVAINNASQPALASDDIPGGGTNIFGRTTAAWTEAIAGIGMIAVKQCPNASSGNVADCPQLGGFLNQNPTQSASDPAITIPNAATATLIGESPNNPRPVVAFVEAGRLFVKRYDPGTDSWLQLADPTSADGALNNSLDGTASEPAIVYDVLGRYSVVWAEFEPSIGNRSGIYVKRLDAANGGAWTGLDRVLNCDRTANATSPDIAVDGTAVPYVTYQEEVPGGDSRIVVMSFVD